MNTFSSLVVLNIENHNVGKCKHQSNMNLPLLLCNHSIKMSQICIILKQLAFFKFLLTVIHYDICLLNLGQKLQCGKM